MSDEPRKLPRSLTVCDVTGEMRTITDPALIDTLMQFSAHVEEALLLIYPKDDDDDDDDDDGPAAELAGLSGADLIRVLRSPDTFEHLVDRMPACTQKDLLRAWGYLRGIYPRLPWALPADEAEMSTDDLGPAHDPDALEKERGLGFWP